MYTDDSILTWGKWKFTALKRISPDWLLGLRNNMKECHDVELMEYINDNLQGIQDRKEGKTQTIEMEDVCRKTIYHTRELAKKAIGRIRSRHSVHSSHIVPQRAYECEKCGYWHLTSKSL